MGLGWGREQVSAAVAAGLHTPCQCGVLVWVLVRIPQQRHCAGVVWFSIRNMRCVIAALV